MRSLLQTGDKRPDRRPNERLVLFWKRSKTGCCCTRPRRQLVYGSRITYSFMPDGTSVGGTPSVLFQTLNAKFPTATWELQFQKAAAVWQAVTNINLAQVSDNGSRGSVSTATSRTTRASETSGSAPSTWARVPWPRPFCRRRSTAAPTPATCSSTPPHLANQLGLRPRNRGDP